MKNGKKVCNELKKVRKQIADANGIEYNPAECTHQGECMGTCPKCESEVKYLENQLKIRRILGKAAIVAGLGISVASCSGVGGDNVAGLEPRPVDSVEIVEMGDVAAPEDSIDMDSMEDTQEEDCKNVDNTK